MMPNGRAIRLGWCLGALVLCVVLGGCDSRMGNALKAAVGLGTKFRAFSLVDAKQGGLVVSRFAVPEDWKASGRAQWNYNDFYLPVHVSARAEAPDGGSWIEFYPAEVFVWLDRAHDRPGPGSGGIHHPGITLPEALVRYIIVRNRSKAKNLRILGSRAVDDLPQAFPKVFTQGAPKGRGLCMRVQYELNGAPVDEEFYGFMGDLVTLSSSGAAGLIHEYHRSMFMVHSLGAKNGKLEAQRPLLGAIATSLEPNPAWQRRLAEVQKMQMDFWNRRMAANYAQIRAAGERSRAISAQNDQFLRNIDAGLVANQRARASAGGGQASESGSDGFDQYIRGTEHMQDQNGVVSDQSNNYNYHWSDGFGQFVHTDDPNLDPNHYLTGNYQKMTPVP